MPIPGHWNTVSITTAPASRTPNRSPICVTVEVSALRSMYFQTISCARNADRILIGNERLFERVEHAGARKAHDGCKRGYGERHGRQRQMGNRAAEPVPASGHQGVDRHEAGDGRRRKARDASLQRQTIQDPWRRSSCRMSASQKLAIARPATVTMRSDDRATNYAWSRTRHRAGCRRQPRSAWQQASARSWPATAPADPRKRGVS